MRERPGFYLADQKPKRDVFYEFKGKKLSKEVLNEQNSQFMRRLEREELIILKELYIDGTKIEANVNRYTFVWQGDAQLSSGRSAGCNRRPLHKI